jgi:anti-sigma-K factor RskA
MTAHDWFIEHQSAFVIRSLEPDEERAFSEHLQGCEECRRAIEQVEREVAWLPMGVPAANPRPGLTRQFVEGALGSPARGRRWLVPAGLAASLLLAVGAWAWAIRKVSIAEATLEAQRSALSAELTMARDTLGIIRQAAVVGHASITAGGSRGGLVIFAEARTHRWNVVVYGMPAPPAGEVCQFWFITDSGMIRGVEVKSDGPGPAFLTLPMPNDTSHFLGAALTLERAGSRGSKPSGPMLAHLML